jgi:hypothetical protein
MLPEQRKYSSLRFLDDLCLAKCVQHRSDRSLVTTEIGHLWLFLATGVLP